MQTYLNVNEMLIDLHNQLDKQEITTSRLGLQKQIIGFSYKLENPLEELTYLQFNRSYRDKFVEFQFSGLKSEQEQKKIVEELQLINPYVAHFLDEQMSNLYPGKIAKQLDNCIRELKEHKDTRRGVISILSADDNSILFNESKKHLEYPCTDSFNFYIKQNKLCLHVNMRSQNMTNVYPYDYSVAQALLACMANELNLKAGTLSAFILFCHKYIR